MSIVIGACVGLIAACLLFLVYDVYRAEQKALLAGMMRPRNGVRIEMTDDLIVYRHLKQAKFSIRKRDVNRSEFVRDNCFDKYRRLDDAIKLFHGEDVLAQFAESDEGFSELLDWVRKQPNHRVVVVELCK